MSGTLAGIDAATLQANLAQAQAALHALQTGQAVVTVNYAMGDGNRSVTYRTANLGQLTAYIAQLQRALGIGTRRAIGVRF